MHIKRWRYILIVATCCIVLVFIFSLQSLSTYQKKITLLYTPSNEQQKKQSFKSHDVEITSSLTKINTQTHINDLLEKEKNIDDKKIQQHLTIFQKNNPSIFPLCWLTFSKEHCSETKCSAVATDKLLNKILLTYKHDALRFIKKRNRYESKPFTWNGINCVCIGQCSSDGKRAGIFIVKKNVIASVENHQRKNLRIVPYPSNGKYNVKSVYPQTLTPVSVKTGKDNENASHFYENEIVVRFRHPLSNDETAKIMRHLKPCSIQRLGYTYVFHTKNKSYAQLKTYFSKNWNPFYVEPHYLYVTNDVVQLKNKKEVPNDTLFLKYQWNLPMIQAVSGWRLSKGSKKVTIAVIDTGVDLNHPDLKGKLVKGYNIIQRNKRPYDDVGHGTHVAGIIGACVNNKQGVAGISWYNPLMPIKALNQSGAGTAFSIAEGIIWAADHGAKVINLSLGNYANAKFLHDAIKYAYDRDVVLVAATGNDNSERPGYPAAYPEVLAVCATDKQKKRACFSNYGNYVDVAAPGESIPSTYPNHEYAALSGTSMATPHVSALAGLIRSQNSHLKNTEVMDIIKKSAVDLGPPGYDKYFGYGQIDVARSLQPIRSSKSVFSKWLDDLKKNIQSFWNTYVK